MTVKGIDVSERFWMKVEATGVCWEWRASVKPNGYGQFGLRAGCTVYAHRFAYQMLVGEIPSGLDLDHLCRNRSCVNPDHLQPVDRGTNLRRSPITFPGMAARSDTCKQGHPWATGSFRSESGRRICRICRNAAKRAAYRRSRV